MSIEMDLYRLDHGSLRRSSMRRGVEYRKFGAETYGKRAYTELIDPEIETDLGQLINLASKLKKMRKRNKQSTGKSTNAEDCRRLYVKRRRGGVARKM